MFTHDNEQMVNPFEGEPHTEDWTFSDKPHFKICLEEYTGLAVKASIHWITPLILLVFALGSPFLFYALFGNPGCVYAILISFPLVIIFYEVNKGHVYRFLSTNTEVMITTTAFKVKVKEQWQVYNRELNHRFVLLPHDKTQEEKIDHSLRQENARKNGQIISPTKIYSDTYHIVYEYMGQRFDIAEVFSRKRALAVIARLKACDEVMNNIAKLGNGEARKPADQWGSQPGDLP